MCKLLEIGKTKTISYRPSANDQVERYNRSSAHIIRCCVVDRHEKWERCIKGTVNNTTGSTTNMMMLGREVMI